MIWREKVFNFFKKKFEYGNKICFVGLGKLGLPCAEACARKGLDVTGYDIVQKTSGYIKIKEKLVDAVKDRDLIFVAVPTPHEAGYDGREPTSDKPVKDFDYTQVKDILKQLAQICSKRQIVILISTVLPGTIRRELADCYTIDSIVYNPYLIAMGTVGHDMINPEMIMIGTKNGSKGSNCSVKAKILSEFYKKICENDPRIECGTWEEVEAIKIFYNTFISNKIALVNMIQDVSNKLGHMNVDIVTDALAKSTMRIMSPKYMKAGMGDGGACHPRDNIALRWLAQRLGLGYDLFESIMNAREKQAETMAKAILKHGANVYVTSDSYKPNTSLTDGSYSLLVQYYIKKHGGNIVDGFGDKVDVILKTHATDKVMADQSTIIFDPWRSHPPAKNVVYYGAV